ncbi:hypothetical protein POJ06DRAFT_261149 [Lipomyces tetrasporus]|uniref:DUF7137 domain-containing protein n=1 Tax=Lipomyces tetrasporus TaxID=54092 RepID=A0AAD7QLN3_9ASCO|nr:uncharacterized protein POJ06DRAFT_261149 [Lipomyces tetrasporus]KAJ8097353.1 hypothetical protein POJ06DRAFT_261149 [Lipomyces tetrasporus]
MKLSIVIFLCCLLLSSEAYAKSPRWLHDLAARNVGLQLRQVSSKTSSRSSITSSVASKTSTSVVSKTPTSESSQSSSVATTAVSSSATQSDSTASSSIDPRSPAGGVSMITPAITDSETYIKVGDYATFSWTYTSLIVSPSAVNVEAYCSVNDYYYPIANVTANDTHVVWNTSAYQETATIPLLVAEYTLYIYDASSNPSSIANPGHLAAYDNLNFGVYTPQPYTPLNDYQCATCSGSFSLIERNVLRGTLAISVITCLFTILFMAR